MHFPNDLEKIIMYLLITCNFFLCSQHWDIIVIDSNMVEKLLIIILLILELILD